MREKRYTAPMQARFWRAILVGIVTAFATYGADQELRASAEAGTTRVREILRSQPARRPAAPGPAPAAMPDLEQALSGRMAALEALIRQDPRSAREALLTAAERDMLHEALPQRDDLVETVLHVRTRRGAVVVEGDGSALIQYAIENDDRIEFAYADPELPAPTCGEEVELSGFRAGRSLLVTNVKIGEKKAGPNACSPLGQQRLAVILLEMSDQAGVRAPVSVYQDVFFGARPDSVKSVVERFSQGKTTITGDVFGYYTLPAGIDTCADPNFVMRRAVEAAGAEADLRPYTRFVFVVPVRCARGGSVSRGSLGCGDPLGLRAPEAAPYSFVYHFAPNPDWISQQDFFFPTIVHELGHNFGAMHARGLRYPPEPVGPDETRRLLYEYGDGYSIMGRGRLQAPAAPHLAMFGWWDPEVDYRTVEEDADVVLAPIHGPAGALKAVKVRRRVNDDWLWLEHRPKSETPQHETLFRGGLTVHKETPATANATDLITFGPDLRDADLVPGATWRDPFGPLLIEVGQPTPAGLPVRIRYEPPCATPLWPESPEAPNGGAPLLIPTTASPECSWKAHADNSWITVSPAGPVRGSAPVEVRALPNPGIQVRHGSITIGRQTFHMHQPPADIRARVELFLPRSGPAGFNPAVPVPVAVAILSPLGSRRVEWVDLWFGSRPGPEASGCGIRIEVADPGVRLLKGGGVSQSAERITGNPLSIEDAACSFREIGSTLVDPARFSLNLEWTQRHPPVGQPGVYVRIGEIGAAEGEWSLEAQYEPPKACPVTVSRPLITALPEGADATVSVAAPADCPWTVSGLPDWVTADRLAGTGPGSVLLVVQPNYTDSSRSAVFRVGAAEAALFQPSKYQNLGIRPRFFAEELIVPASRGARRIELDAPQESFPRLSASQDWLRVGWDPESPVNLAIVVEWDWWHGDSSRAGFVRVNGAELPVVQMPAKPGRRADVAAGRGLSDKPGPALETALREPAALAVADDGSLLVGERRSSRILKVSPDGHAEIWTGSHIGEGADWYQVNSLELRGCISPTASFHGATSLAPGPDGSLYLFEPSEARILQLQPSGKTSMVAGLMTLATPDGFKMVDMGWISAITSGGNGQLLAVSRVSCGAWVITPGQSAVRVAGNGKCESTGDGGPALQAGLNAPEAVASDPAGRIYISEPGSHRIRVVEPGGSISTFAGAGEPGLSPDGVAAAGAPLLRPTLLARAPGGQIYFLEAGAMRVRTVTKDGLLQTVAAFDPSAAPLDPASMAVGADGSIYLADASGHTVMRWSGGSAQVVLGIDSRSPLGDGGPAESAWLSRPTAIVRDGQGGIILADTAHNKIRRIRSDGIITTIGGTGRPGSSGDGGPAIEAEFNQPEGLALDAAGNLYVSDTGNHRIRRITPEGIVERVAGTVAGFSGDGGDALEARLNIPKGIAIGPDGGLYIADSRNYRVRAVGADGRIRTVAGDARFAGYTPGHLPTEVSFFNLEDVGFDPGGRLWISDGGLVLYFVGLDGLMRSLPIGAGHTITRFAFDSGGNVWASSGRVHSLLKVDSATGRPEVAAGVLQPGMGAPGWASMFTFYQPSGVAVMEDGSVVVADSGNDRLVRIRPPDPGSAAPDSGSQ